ncbi:hypothetical protein GBA52_005410 [Prunus armeniaca]|nr:hypothetical protein GBA52_005410 [Prunus armeniaca]
MRAEEHFGASCNFSLCRRRSSWCLAVSARTGEGVFWCLGQFRLVQANERFRALCGFGSCK